MKSLVFGLFAFLICPSLPAQTTESGDLVTRVNAIISAMPGASGDDYTAPSAAQKTDWDALLTDLFAGSYAAANTKAAALGYDLVEFTDTGNGTVYYLLETTSGSTNYWGTYVLNPSACRSELVLMSPHPKKDFNTGKQGIYCFKTTDAWFFMLAGTDRCNQSAFSSCSGTTSVCSGTSESYRISDMAHVDDSIWQGTTSHISDHFSNTWFVQLHGFNKLASDPYVIMSNGTRETPSPDKIVSLRDELLVVDNTLTFKIAHIDLTWDRLIGFSNTNGRYINNSTNACTANAVNTTGRFLHVEQEKTKLRTDSAAWHKMAIALGEAFNAGGCAAVPPLPVTWGNFSATLSGDAVYLEWEVFSEVENDYFEVQKSSDGIDFQPVARVPGRGTSFVKKTYSLKDTPWPGPNFYRLKQVDFGGAFVFSKVVFVQFSDPAQPRVYGYDGQVFIRLEAPEAVVFKWFNAQGQCLFEDRFFGQSKQFRPGPGNVFFYQIRAGQHLYSGVIVL